jgi:hypothetical protein
VMLTGENLNSVGNSRQVFWGGLFWVGHRISF